MIEFKNASFSYSGAKEQAGLTNINLQIEKGQVVLACGESGCGKTTLTRLVNGLIPHYYEGTLTGEITICGKSIGDAPLYSLASVVGSVFQNPRTQFFNVDTTSELAFGCENLGMEKQEILRRIAMSVEELSLHSLMGRSIFHLSGGEKQKIACGLVHALCPDVLVLDEPTSNLDVRGIHQLKSIIADWKAMGKTVLIAEHRLYFLKDLADRVIYMENGEIKELYSGRDFFSKPPSFYQERGLRTPSLKSLFTGEHKPPFIKTNLTFDNILFGYSKEKNLLDIPHMDLPEGGVTAVIGHNGAGKTTFARSLCGLLKKDKSVLHYNGRTLGQKKRLSACYMVMQDVNHQLFAESVLDEVLLSMDKENKEGAEAILDSLDLLPYKELHPASLSGGQKQRLAIASSMASKQDILIFDEPTSGLDLRHMKEASDGMKKLSRNGKTVLLITHDPELILSCCTHIIHIETGRLQDDYPLDLAGLEKLILFFSSDPAEDGCDD